MIDRAASRARGPYRMRTSRPSERDAISRTLGRRACLRRTEASHEGTIGIARAEMKIGMVNLAYNFSRLAWLHARVAPA
ncbi:MAG: hypothetical protein JWR80_3316 [Bradyrhizobium sp.]|nr:hypothetical protein [Bradyrhizobium sp.]